MLWGDLMRMGCGTWDGYQLEWSWAGRPGALLPLQVCFEFGGTLVIFLPATSYVVGSLQPE